MPIVYSKKPLLSTYFYRRNTAALLLVPIHAPRMRQTAHFHQFRSFLRRCMPKIQKFPSRLLHQLFIYFPRRSISPPPPPAFHLFSQTIHSAPYYSQLLKGTVVAHNCALIYYYFSILTTLLVNIANFFL